ncbi:hypothetical protein T484DRAFT_1929666, partial [Baffinella frigidus]
MRVMLASWALAAALALHGADAFSPSGVQLPASRLTSSSMPLAARPAAFWAPAAKRAGATQLHMAATVPKIIQGGMGVQVSSWKLAREVGRKGELGVISGTAMDVVLLRWLQEGDPGGLYRKALATFPDQGMAQRCIAKYFVEGGKDKAKPYKPLQMWVMEPSQELNEISVMGNYCEVWLAKHNDDGTPIESVIGINCLTKIQLPVMSSLYGAMLADGDYVLMGAGIPMEVPGILDRLSRNEDVKMAIDVDDAVLLASAMLKRATGEGPTRGIQGFVIEFPTAGGHNAPPRGFKYDATTGSHALSLNDKGEPIYGPKDEVDLVKFKNAVGDLPFYLAGYYARPEKLQEVLALGGAGVQVGTSFAFSEESGLWDQAKQQVLQQIANDDLVVYTDPVASPTGFPFKVLELDGSLSVKDNYEERPRVCNLGYLRTAYEKDGKLGYRCASEPIDDYLKKGGDKSATEGRKCLCNGLMANAGVPQVSPFKKAGEDSRYVEETLITAGDDVNQ